VGNTFASEQASIDNMPEELDVETYVEVVMPTAPEGATYTGIFRGEMFGEELYLAKVPASQTTYNDKGFDKVDPVYGVPQFNSTGGYHFKFATIYQDSIIGITTEMGDDTLVFSAGWRTF
jgi:catechol-2,3-dioxygenase